MKTIKLQLKEEINEELENNPKFWYEDEKGDVIKPTSADIIGQYIIDEINIKRTDNAMKKAMEDVIKLTISDIIIE